MGKMHWLVWKEGWADTCGDARRREVTKGWYERYTKVHSILLTRLDKRYIKDLIRLDQNFENHFQMLAPQPLALRLYRLVIIIYIIIIFIIIIIIIIISVIIIIVVIIIIINADLSSNQQPLRWSTL